MADPEAVKPPSDDDTANLSKQLAALILKEDDRRLPTTVERERHTLTSNPPSPTSSLEAPPLLRTSLPRSPLFGSMREALESTGQVKEEPGGYVIKRYNGREQPSIHWGASAGKSKNCGNRNNKHRCNNKSNNVIHTPAGDEADAAGYTVIRRRSSCDETRLDDSATALNSHSTGRRNSRTSNPGRGTRKQPPRTRRGSISALSPSSSSLAGISPPLTSSVPPGFQPRPATSRVVIRPPSGLTSAASGWVTKAAVPAKHTTKIEEPPVEALWPEAKSTATSHGTTESGWDVTASIAGDLLPQTWTETRSNGPNGATSPLQVRVVEDDDLLTRLGVTL